jgi:hypothetical protein
MRSDPLLKAQHFRKEARRIRRDAKRIIDKENRRQLLDIAAQYDRLAEGLEQKKISDLHNSGK